MQNCHAKKVETPDPYLNLYHYLPKSPTFFLFSVVALEMLCFMTFPHPQLSPGCQWKERRRMILTLTTVLSDATLLPAGPASALLIGAWVHVKFLHRDDRGEGGKPSMEKVLLLME